MRRLSVVKSLLGSALAAGLVASTGGAAPGAPAPALRVVATTTLIASIASEVAAGRASVTSLLPVAASPETYEPTPRDAVRLHQADLVIENGAGLEAWLAPLLASAGVRPERVVDCSAGLPVVAANPHLWLDPVYARHYVAAIRDGMIAADPGGAAIYRHNAAAFDAQLVQLQAWIGRQIATLPVPNRKMIVFHNAWLYYNQRFGLVTLGEIEETPGAEPSAAHIAQLVDAARANHVQAIFAEPEYDPRLAQAVARSAGIPHIAVLYDDSIGTAPGTRDYIDMVRTDTTTIVKNLR